LDKDLISYRYSSGCCCSSCWGGLFKKAPSFQMESGWHLAVLLFK